MLNVHGKKRRVPIRPNATAGPLSRRFQPQMRLRYKKSGPPERFVTHAQRTADVCATKYGAFERSGTVRVIRSRKNRNLIRRTMGRAYL